MMKKSTVIGLSLFIWGFFGGCVLENRTDGKGSLSNDMTASDHVINSQLELVRNIAWEESEKCSLNATLINERTPIKDLPPDKPKHIFEIKEVNSGKTLLRKTGSETALSMEIAARPLEDGKILFVSHSAGSADVLKIYVVDCNRATEIFSEAYRDFYSYTQFYEDARQRFVVFTADNLTEFDNRLMVTKWNWDGKKFSDTASFSYDDFLLKMVGFRASQNSKSKNTTGR